MFVLLITESNDYYSLFVREMIGFLDLLTVLLRAFCQRSLGVGWIVQVLLWAQSALNHSCCSCRNYSKSQRLDAGSILVCTTLLVFPRKKCLPVCKRRAAERHLKRLDFGLLFRTTFSDNL
jgi:hypothetical protein